MDTYQIEWKASALREIKRLDRHVVPRIIGAIEQLRDNPFPPEVRKIQGGKHSYRIRVGDYRVIYEVSRSRVLIQIVRVRHRKDAYRPFA